jgi:uncharacterized membrane protein
MVKSEVIVSSQVGLQSHAGPAVSWWESARDRWITLHRGIQLAAVLAALVLISLAFGVSIGTIALIGVVLLCPLMMIGMMVGIGFGMHSVRGRHHHQGASQAADIEDAPGEHAREILRERYARGELDKDQFDDMLRDLS